jgi:hypothetical protein
MTPKIKIREVKRKFENQKFLNALILSLKFSELKYGMKILFSMFEWAISFSA